MPGHCGGCRWQGFTIWGYSVKVESPAGFALASVTASSSDAASPLLLETARKVTPNLLPSGEEW